MLIKMKKLYAQKAIFKDYSSDAQHSSLAIMNSWQSRILLSQESNSTVVSFRLQVIQVQTLAHPVSKEDM